MLIIIVIILILLLIIPCSIILIFIEFNMKKNKRTKPKEWSFYYQHLNIILIQNPYTIVDRASLNFLVFNPCLPSWIYTAMICPIWVVENDCVGSKSSVISP